MWTVYSHSHAHIRAQRTALCQILNRSEVPVVAGAASNSFFSAEQRRLEQLLLQYTALSSKDAQSELQLDYRAVKEGHNYSIYSPHLQARHTQKEVKAQEKA